MTTPWEPGKYREKSSSALLSVGVRRVKGGFPRAMPGTVGSWWWGQCAGMVPCCTVVLKEWPLTKMLWARGSIGQSEKQQISTNKNKFLRFPSGLYQCRKCEFHAHVHTCPGWWHIGGQEWKGVSAGRASASGNEGTCKNLVCLLSPQRIIPFPADDWKYSSEGFLTERAPYFRKKVIEH